MENLLGVHQEIKEEECEFMFILKAQDKWRSIWVPAWCEHKLSQSQKMAFN